jgi:hypothetical protein
VSGGSLSVFPPASPTINFVDAVTFTTTVFYPVINAKSTHLQNATTELQKARIGATRACRGLLRLMPKFALMAALFSMALIACGPKPEAARALPPKNVLVTRVTSVDVPVQLRQFGWLSSPESVNVQPQVSGRVTEVHFVEGRK